MPKTILKAPAGHASVCVEGKQYNVDRRGFVEVDSNDVAAIQSHNSDFLTPDQVRASISESTVVDQEARRAIHDIHAAASKADRTALFAHLKAMGVVVNRTTKTEELRKILEVELAKADAKVAQDTSKADAA